jgi:hypothetical protein
MTKKQAFEIDSNRCWCCGKEFDKENYRTSHHAIPVSFKPMFNVQLPICIKCHQMIHTKMQHLATLKTKIKGLEKYVKELKEISER